MEQDGEIQFRLYSNTAFIIYNTSYLSHSAVHLQITEVFVVS